MGNPILKNFKNFSLYILGLFAACGVYQSLLTFGLKVNLQSALIDNFTFNLLLFGLGLSFWYSAKYISFESNTISKIFISHLIGGILTSIIWCAIGYYIIFSIFSPPVDYTTFFYNTLPWRFLIGILFYFLITAFYYVVIYYTSYQERIIKEAELKNLITEAELKSLKFQINPHFIFNSLNSMSALTTLNPEKARGMILKLAEFLRYTLANSEKQKSKLSEELRNIRLYLEIEKIRFEDKFEFTEDVDPICKNVPVPSMILQPLFENAIKHAVYESLGKVTLHLSCKCHNEFMQIIVENNFESSDTPKKGTGVGLNNIRNRLGLIYNRKDLLEVKKEENLFTVILYIPIEN
jgi:sensor histidine kinase YesM